MDDIDTGLTFSPLLVGLMLKDPSSWLYALPFVTAGTLKIVYDLALYWLFKISSSAATDPTQTTAAFASERNSGFAVLSSATSLERSSVELTSATDDGMAEARKQELENLLHIVGRDDGDDKTLAPHERGADWDEDSSIPRRGSRSQSQSSSGEHANPLLEEEMEL